MVSLVGSAKSDSFSDREIGTRSNSGSARDPTPTVAVKLIKAIHETEGHVSHAKLILGLSIVLTSIVGVAFADTGPGGGCHADFYFNLDAQGRITNSVFYCRHIDCPNSCPPANSSPLSGGYTTCLCPGATSIQCNFGAMLVPGGIQYKCLEGCPGGKTCWGPRPQGGGYYPGGTIGGVGYANKMTCWCE